MKWRRRLMIFLKLIKINCENLKYLLVSYIGPSAGDLVSLSYFPSAPTLLLSFSTSRVSYTSRLVTHVYFTTNLWYAINHETSLQNLQIDPIRAPENLPANAGCI